MCRQLGFSLAVGVTTESEYGGAEEGVRVWVEGVGCEGGEGDIGECVSEEEWGMVSSGCEDHAHDAGVICAGKSGNLSNQDTNGAKESVIVSEVSSFQRLKCMQEWYLGWEKVSCLERCPQFRSVLIKRGRFHTYTHTIQMTLLH